jgi:hypothetical protein
VAQKERHHQRSSRNSEKQCDLIFSGERKYPRGKQDRIGKPFENSVQHAERSDQQQIQSGRPRAGAFSNNFDTALLISADGDLTTPVKHISKTVGKRIIVVYPPDRRSFTLENVATAHIFLGRGHLANNQFPLQVKKANGFILNRPAAWPI